MQFDRDWKQRHEEQQLRVYHFIKDLRASPAAGEG
jgi:hypothetical protein